MKRENKTRTSVYIIAKTDGLNIEKFRKTKAEGIFKIGYSVDPERRLSQMVSMPMELLLISEYEFTTISEAKYVEQAIHSVLHFHRYKYEWFSLSQDDLILVDRLIVNLLKGSCHYHEKHFFVQPPLTTREMLEKCRLPIADPEFRAKMDKIEATREKFLTSK